MRFLLLGSKEYPTGSSRGFDPLPSGGYEKYTDQLASALANRGHAVSIITRRFPNRPTEETNGRIHVWRVPWVNGFFFRTPTFAFFTLFKGLQVPCDIIISNGVWSGLAAWIISRTKNRPWMARPGGIAWSQPQYSGWVQSLLRGMERFVYRRAQRVIFTSEAERLNFRKKMGFMPNRFTIIPTGVTIPRMCATRRENAVLFVGRLIPVKGITYLIQAMKNVQAKLWVVGDGPQKAEAETLARKEGVAATFFGYRADVDTFLRRAKVFVLPSLSEGLPLSLLEAYAHQIPCVVTDIGLPARHLSDALVVPQGNIEALASAIRKLLKNPALRRRLSRNAYQKAKTFRWSKTARRYEEVAKTCAE